MNGQVGRRTGHTRSGVEDIRRRVMAGSSGRAAAGNGALTDTNPVVEGFSLAHLSPATSG